MADKTTGQKATLAAAKALRQKNNELTAAYFAAAMLGMIFLFSAPYLLGLALQRRSSKNGGSFAKVVKCATRGVRSVTLRKIPFFQSVGHAAVLIIYIIINVILAFANVDWTAGTLNNWAKRLGWVAACNLALITFLALKNTPLAFLTAYSYERLNVLHRMAGYTAIASMLIHALVYIQAWNVSNNLKDLLEEENIMGIVAGLAVLIVFVSTLLLRKSHYEVFYVIHVIMFLLIVIAVAMHRPNVSKKAVWIPIFTGAIWACDRLIRTGRIAWYSYGNAATVTPLAHGGIRIVLNRSASRAVPGSHLFLWMPKIRAMETHPFTISSVNPIELVVAAHDGFTKDLLVYATKYPGASLRASMDGPYGTLPSFILYDQVILIAGGSGASFTFGIAVDLVRRLSPESKTVINFIWIVREQASISWFASALEELQSSPFVRLTIHVTRLQTLESTDPTPLPLSLAEKTLDISEDITPAQSSPSSLHKMPNYNVDVDIEKRSLGDASSSDVPALITLPGRPDVESLVKGCVAAAESREKIMVSACGPAGLMDVTRRTVAGLVSDGGEGPTVDLHLEQFSW